MDKRNAHAVLLSGLVCLALLNMGAKNPFAGLSQNSLKERVQTLESENAKLSAEVDELTRKLDILTQRVNASCGEGDAGTFDDSNISLSLFTPEVPGLETVRLKPEDGAPASAPANKPGGKLIITKSGDSTTYIDKGGPLPGTNYVPLPDPEFESDGGSDSAPPPSLARNDSSSDSGSSSSSLMEPVAFEEIRGLVEQGESGRAEGLMKKYLSSHAGGANEDRVAHWLGTSLYGKGDYAGAIKAFKIVTEKHYESALAPDSLYYVGLAYIELGKTKEAGDAFREVKILYPFSNAAKKADEKLASCCP